MRQNNSMKRNLSLFVLIYLGSLSSANNVFHIKILHGLSGKYVASAVRDIGPMQFVPDPLQKVTDVTLLRILNEIATPLRGSVNEFILNRITDEDGIRSMHVSVMTHNRISVYLLNRGLAGNSLKVIYISPDVVEQLFEQNADLRYLGFLCQTLLHLPDEIREEITFAHSILTPIHKPLILFHMEESSDMPPKVFIYGNKQYNHQINLFIATHTVNSESMPIPESYSILRLSSTGFTLSLPKFMTVILEYGKDSMPEKLFSILGSQSTLYMGHEKYILRGELYQQIFQIWRSDLQLDINPDTAQIEFSGSGLVIKITSRLFRREDLRIFTDAIRHYFEGVRTMGDLGRVLCEREYPSIIPQLNGCDARPRLSDDLL